MPGPTPSTSCSSSPASSASGRCLASGPRGSTSPVRRACRSVVDGLTHLRRAPNVRMSFVVDIIAMTFGQPMVLFPAVGAIVIGGGSVTAGILLASFAVGGIVSSLVSGRVTGLRWQGLGDPQRDRLLRPRDPRLRSGARRDRDRWARRGVERLRCVNRSALVARLPCASPSPAGPTTSARSSASRSCRQRFPTTCVAAPRASSPSSSRAVPGSVRCSPAPLATLTATWVPPVVGGVLVVVLVLVTVARVPSFRHYDALDPRP